MSSQTSVYVKSAPRCAPCSLVAPSSTIQKRLVVCCDGTGCASDQGHNNNATNITRLSRMIANVGIDQSGKPIPQLVHYQSGVATGWMSPISKSLQGALGNGLSEKVCEGYTYLVNNYGPGDEILIFGFSRGAYTARSLASFVCQVGLLSPGMMDYFDEIFSAYKKRDRKTERGFAEMRWAKEYVRPGELGFDTGRQEKWTRYDWIRKWAHYHVEVKVVGVFDTVGSVGMSGWVAQPGEDVTFYSSKLHPKIRYAFHALALDESRGNFPPTMFYLDQACIDANVRLRQCWFPGYHGCVGGVSQAKDDRNSVDEIALAWMIDQLTKDNLLQINARALEYPILSRLADYLPTNDSHMPAPRTPQEANERRIDWSDGKLVETQNIGWHVASQVATERWDYVRRPGQYHASEIGRNGKTYELDYTYFDEQIHPCVYHRIRYRGYEPKSMPLTKWERVRRANSKPGQPGHEWIKTDRSGRTTVRIPEYVIPDLKTRENEMQHWTGSLELKIAPGEFMRKLDQANGINRTVKRPVVVERVDSGYGGEEDDEEEYLSVKTETLKVYSSSSPERSPSMTKVIRYKYEEDV